MLKSCVETNQEYLEAVYWHAHPDEGADHQPRALLRFVICYGRARREGDSPRLPRPGRYRQDVSYWQHLVVRLDPPGPIYDNAYVPGVLLALLHHSGDVPEDKRRAHRSRNQAMR